MNIPAPFTWKQHKYLRRCMNSWLNVAEGGKRGSKNVLQTMAFCIKLENHPDRLHLVSGVSITTAKLNIIDCDGYGVMNFFEGRCREGKYKNRDCLYVQTANGEKIVLVSGGGKQGDEKLIKGNTYGMAYVTEANECAKIFLQEVFDRTMSSSDRTVFHDLNPKAPSHWYYQEILAPHEEKQRLNLQYGYNYGHFTIADNLSVSDDKLKSIIGTYDRRSVWFLRDIKGERQQASGLIYPRFANNPAAYIKAAKDIPRLLEISVGLDFGGNASGHAFVATGITENYRELVALASKKILHKDFQKGIAPKEIDEQTVEFVHFVIQTFGGCDYLEWDNEAVTLGTGVYRALEREFPQVTVRGCYKGEINNRINLTYKLITEQRFWYTEHCKTLVAALSEAIWDPAASEKGEDVRLDNGTSDIDTLDAFEYSFTRRINKFLQ